MMVDMCLHGLRSCSPNSVPTLWSPCIQGRENRLLSHRGVATYTRCSWQAGNYQGSCVPIDLCKSPYEANATLRGPSTSPKGPRYCYGGYFPKS